MLYVHKRGVAKVKEGFGDAFISYSTLLNEKEFVPPLEHAYVFNVKVEHVLPVITLERYTVGDEDFDVVRVLGEPVCAVKVAGERLNQAGELTGEYVYERKVMDDEDAQEIMKAGKQKEVFLLNALVVGSSSTGNAVCTHFPQRVPVRIGRYLMQQLNRSEEYRLMLALIYLKAHKISPQRAEGLLERVHLHIKDKNLQEKLVGFLSIAKEVPVSEQELNSLLNEIYAIMLDYQGKALKEHINTKDLFYRVDNYSLLRTSYSEYGNPLFRLEDVKGQVLTVGIVPDINNAGVELNYGVMAINGKPLKSFLKRHAFLGKLQGLINYCKKVPPEQAREKIKEFSALREQKLFSSRVEQVISQLSAYLKGEIKDLPLGEEIRKARDLSYACLKSGMEGSVPSEVPDAEKAIAGLREKVVMSRLVQERKEAQEKLAPVVVEESPQEIMEDSFEELEEVGATLEKVRRRELR